VWSSTSLLHLPRHRVSIASHFCRGMLTCHHPPAHPLTRSPARSSALSGIQARCRALPPSPARLPTLASSRSSVRDILKLVPRSAPAAVRFRCRHSSMFRPQRARPTVSGDVGTSTGPAEMRRVPQVLPGRVEQEADNSIGSCQISLLP
jgi:hypothetical protein